MKPISTAVYQTLVRLRLLPPLPTVMADVEHQEQQERILPPQEIFEPSRSDSDRRKQLALQALQQKKLNSKK